MNQDERMTQEAIQYGFKMKGSQSESTTAILKKGHKKGHKKGQT